MTKKQARLAAKMWVSDLIEAMADNVVDCGSLRERTVKEKDISRICKAVFEMGAVIRGDHPQRLTVKEIVDYVKSKP